MAKSKQPFLGERKKVPVSTLVVDPALQVRAKGLNKEHASDLAADAKAGDKLPDPWVMDVEGSGLLVVGGFHTVEAAKINKRESMYVIVGKGTYADAQWISAGSNNDPVHKALKMTGDDKQRAIRMALLANEALPVRERHSARKIAEHIGVSHTNVSDMKRKLEGRQGSKKDKPEPKEDTTGGIMSENWQDWPIDEVMDLPEYIGAALKKDKIVTLGQLMTELDQGVTFGLKRIALKSLYEKADALRPEAERKTKPKDDAPPPFDWKVRESQIGGAVRGCQAVVSYFGPEEKKSDEYKAIEKLLESVLDTFKAWKKRLAK